MRLDTLFSLHKRSFRRALKDSGKPLVQIIPAFSPFWEWDKTCQMSKALHPSQTDFIILLRINLSIHKTDVCLI